MLESLYVELLPMRFSAVTTVSHPSPPQPLDTLSMSTRRGIQAQLDFGAFALLVPAAFSAQAQKKSGPVRSAARRAFHDCRCPVAGRRPALPALAMPLPPSYSLTWAFARPLSSLTLYSRLTRVPGFATPEGANVSTWGGEAAGVAQIHAMPWPPVPAFWDHVPVRVEPLAPRRQVEATEANQYALGTPPCPDRPTPSGRTSSRGEILAILLGALFAFQWYVPASTTCHAVVVAMDDA